MQTTSVQTPPIPPQAADRQPRNVMPSSLTPSSPHHPHSNHPSHTTFASPQPQPQLCHGANKLKSQASSDVAQNPLRIGRSIMITTPSHRAKTSESGKAILLALACAANGRATVLHKAQRLEVWWGEYVPYFPSHLNPLLPSFGGLQPITLRTQC